MVVEKNLHSIMVVGGHSRNLNPGYRYNGDNTQRTTKPIVIVIKLVLYL